MTLTEFFPHWTQTLGWTLLHSLWQALILFAFVKLALHLIPSRSSQVRYAVACVGLALFTTMNLFTFFYLLPASTAHQIQAFSLHKFSQAPAASANTFSFSQTLYLIYAFADANMYWFMALWCCGATLFVFRLAGSWWYISRLRSEAELLDSDWQNRLQDLAHQLRIGRRVTMALSARVNSPMVIGFLKPVVLVPVSVMAGLSAEQIEAVLIHELAHIRRHDYLVNLLQSFIEAIFFFNPFVWILSNIIRREREYCCDDEVVHQKRSSIAYVRALAQLEEARLERPALALSLAENKNQLLNRIKRIMETSAKHYSGKDRIIPALLLLIGLTCASWLSIKNETSVDAEKQSAVKPIADTVIRINGKSGHYSRQSITTYDEHGKPHEEITEEYTGDEALRPFIAVTPLVDPIVPIPPMPDMSGMAALAPMMNIPGIPAIAPDVFVMPQVGMGPMWFQPDTIPGNTFRFHSGGNWEEFSKAFEEKFRDQFGDFYKSHQADFDKMMKDLEKNFSNDFANEFAETWANASKDWARSFEEIQIPTEEMEEAMEAAREAQELAIENMNAFQHDQLRESQEDMQEHARNMQEHARNMQERAMEMQYREQDLSVKDRKMQRFEEELKVQLVKDGYLGKNENIETLNWGDNSEIWVNGKKIKEADQKKYNDLHEKYFKGDYKYRE